MGQLDRDWFHDRKPTTEQPEQTLTPEEKQQLQELLQPVKKPFVLKFTHLISIGLFLIALALFIGLKK